MFGIYRYVSGIYHLFDSFQEWYGMQQNIPVKTIQGQIYVDESYKQVKKKGLPDHKNPSRVYTTLNKVF